MNIINALEVENTIDELKVHQLVRKTHVRSQNPREVVQEIYGWLLGHWAVRLLIFQAASSAGVSPLRLKILEHYESSAVRVALFQRSSAEELPFFSIG